MVKNNAVVFKGGKNGLKIQLDKQTDFETIRAVLSQKLKDSQKFFGDSETPVIFTGRELAAEEEAELLEIIGEHTNLKVLKPVSEEPPPIIPETLFSAAEHLTLFHHGNLRSGAHVEGEGSVVIIGDVNPGAEVVAGRNAVVLGSLRGMVYAGRGGDKNSFVAALTLNPIQLRICDIITHIPQEPSAKRVIKPMCAYIDEGRINVAPLSGI